MTKSIVAVTALAGSLLLVPVGPASAGALDGMKGLAAPQAGTVHLVGQGGGGGDGFSGGGGDHAGGGIGGGGRGSPSIGGGHMAGRDFGGHGAPDVGGRIAARDFDHGAARGDPDFRHGRTAMDRDHEHDRGFRHGRHGHFVGGVWVWDYGPGYYAGDDCYWLERRAETTGSRYWWSRYQACMGYY